MLIFLLTQFKVVNSGGEAMKYPQEVMRLSELKKMGFTEEWLLYVFRMQGKRGIAWKKSPAENSPILFDTEALEKFRKACCTGR